MTITTARNANLQDLATLLAEQDARKIDVVAPAHALEMSNGTLTVHGAEQQITLDGVTTVDGHYRPTTIFDESIATRLNIPTAYLKRLRAERPDLYDANINGILHGHFGDDRYEQDYSGLEKNFLFRGFRAPDGGVGVARMIASDRFRIFDNLDAVTAVLGGIKGAGIDAQVKSCDLTERRMTVKIIAPEIATMAPELLKGYRSPFTGQEGADNPIVFAGLRVSNSETGGGAFSIVPEITIQVCSNGMVLTKEAMRSVHLGGRLEQGLVNWSADTVDLQAELISAKTRDAVKAFLSEGFLTQAIAGITEDAAKPVTDAVKTVTKVAKELAFSDEHRAGVLDHFIKGGQMTAGGVMNAITSYTQTIEDADTANSMESQALQAMSLV